VAPALWLRGGAQPEVLFDLLSDLPHYEHWLSGSEEFGKTVDVEPYPVRLGTRYHDGKPDEFGKDWWGSVTGFQPPGSIDFHHTIHVRRLRATVDVHIHYSFEKTDKGTVVGRWPLLDFIVPVTFRPLRAFTISKFDTENVRTLDEIMQYAQVMPH
jgi:hypothetical protein